MFEERGGREKTGEIVMGLVQKIESTTVQIGTDLMGLRRDKLLAFWEGKLTP